MAGKTNKKEESRAAKKKAAKKEAATQEAKKRLDEYEKLQAELAAEKQCVEDITESIEYREGRLEEYQERLDSSTQKLNSANQKLAKVLDVEKEELKKNEPLKKEKLGCGRCGREYALGSATPRVLSCGHSLCEACIQKIKVNGEVECPWDSKVTKNAGNLRKNFAIIGWQTD